MAKERPTEEMSSLVGATIVFLAMVVTMLTVQCRRTNWGGRPREGHRVVVELRCTCFHVVPQAFSFAPLGRPQDLLPRRDFGAQEQARALVRRRTAGSSTMAIASEPSAPELLGDGSESSNDVVMVQVPRKFSSYEALYPAATELRNSLGNEICSCLEKYRRGIEYLAFYTVRYWMTSPTNLPRGIRRFVRRYIPHIKTYVRSRWGEVDSDLFEDAQHHLVARIDGVFGWERPLGIQFRDRMAWQVVKALLRREPIFWLVYNLLFPVGVRQSWEQLSLSAMECLLSFSHETPAWPIQLRGMEEWHSRENRGLWSCAVLEAFADMRCRFGLAPTRAPRA